jgi:hypothetical protein
MLKLPHVLPLAVLFVLSACSKTETDTAPVGPPPFPPVAETAANTNADAKLNAEPFQGVDANQNGVRDDVEAWIVTNVKTRDDQYALAQVARAMNNALVQAKSNVSDDALTVAYQGLQKAYICETTVNKDGNAGMFVAQVESSMINRPDRVQAYTDLQTRYMKIGFKPLPANQVSTPCEFQTTTALPVK